LPTIPICNSRFVIGILNYAHFYRSAYFITLPCLAKYFTFSVEVSYTKVPQKDKKQFLHIWIANDERILFQIWGKTPNALFKNLYKHLIKTWNLTKTQPTAKMRRVSRLPQTRLAKMAQCFATFSAPREKLRSKAQPAVNVPARLVTV